VFLVGWIVGAPLLEEVAEGVDRTRLPMWRLWVVLGVTFVATVAALYRTRKLLCLRCARGPLEPLPSEPGRGATRRTILRATGSAAVATAAGAAGIIIPNRGWLAVGRASSRRRSRPNRRRRTRSGKRRASGLLASRPANVMVSDISLDPGASATRVPSAFSTAAYHVDIRRPADAGSERLGQATGASRSDLSRPSSAARPGTSRNDTLVNTS
jgi:hypothetical protein